MFEDEAMKSILEEKEKYWSGAEGRSITEGMNNTFKKFIKEV